MKHFHTMLAMFPASVSVSVVFLASLAPRPIIGAVTRAKSQAKSCALNQCSGKQASPGDGDSLLEVSSSTKGGCGPKFTPAHFSCSSCDVGTCSGCNNVICDLSKCIGKFYSQECWCTKPLNPKVEKIFCDSDCTGGLCDTKGLTCKTRESACKPWWWCKLPPPKEEPESFLQKMSSRQGSCGKQESSSVLNARLAKDRKELHAASLLQESNHGTQKKGMKRAIETFDFQPGQWGCESAMMPPPDEDPVTLQQYAAGFIVFDKDTCTGSYFKQKCFCYDKFLYLRGADPKTSELDCDAGCGQGPCSGKTCGIHPPPPLPAPAPPPPIDPLLQELATEGMLRNYGTQMSPVN